MPLVIVCGHPCVGKSTAATALAKSLQSAGRTVQVVNEESLGITKAAGYANSEAEKVTRGSLKAAVVRAVTKKTCVIADSMNYIKGYRYELFRIAREHGTPACVLFVDAPQEVAATWNKGREDAYPAEMLDELWTRLEMPDPENRWDSPMFRIKNGSDTKEVELPHEQIQAHLYNESVKVPVNVATVKKVIAEPNFLNELDSTTNDIVDAIVAAQISSAVAGDKITVPHATNQVVLLRKSNIVELRRLRRQFIALAKVHPPSTRESKSSAGDEFVKYLNMHLASS